MRFPALPLKLVLASASPRRKELLETAGLVFDVRPADVDESQVAGESPADYVRRLAEEKAAAVRRPGELTLGADTTVVLDAETLGKPADDADARAMLQRLAGRSHDVLTGWCLFAGDQSQSGVETTRVFFTAMTADQIDRYVRSGEPLDKAGAYGIQGLASKFVERIEGCYSNVVGLPTARIYRALNEFSIQRP